MLGLAACANPTSAPPTASPQNAAMERGLALVEKIEVAANASGQWQVIARGELPDACTALTEPRVERTNQVFVVTLSTERPADRACAQAVAPYEKTIPLDVSGLTPGDYVVVVNGVSGTLAIKGEAVAQQPSPTPTEPAAQPTATQSAPTATATQPTPAPTATQVNSGNAADCTNVAAFYADVTIPDGTLFKQGEKFTKTWRVRNEGTCTWRGYSLAFVGGEQMSAPPLSPIPGSVPPGEQADITVELVAPQRGGDYTGNWQFQTDKGTRFGVGPGTRGTLYTAISVVYSGSEISVGGTPAPGSANVPLPSSCGAQGNSGFESQVLNLFNSARSQAGLAPLSAQGLLENAALRHAVDMACSGFIGHAGTDGSSPKSRVQAQGYNNWNSAVENVYGWSDATPQTAFEWWWNSPIHHAAIMKPEHAVVGIAYVVRGGTGYFVAVFARP
jgi:uncharacterized protein YkwD